MTRDVSRFLSSLAQDFIEDVRTNFDRGQIAIFLSSLAQDFIEEKTRRRNLIPAWDS